MSTFVTPTTTMNENSIIGANIRYFRDKLGLNQEAFAAYLNTSREMINYYENGKRTIPSGIISKAAELFGMDAYDLYLEDKEQLESNIVFAFRAQQLDVPDLNHIAQFQKIVRNYLQMKKALADG